MTTPYESALRSVRLFARGSSGQSPADAGRTRPTEDKEVVGDHAEPDPPLHPLHAVIAASRQSVPLFQDADSSFTARPPAQRSPEPARAWLPTTPRQGHVAYAAQLSRVLVCGGAKAAV